jgi:ABC-2 type transport system ATP-binding protein
MDSIVVEHLTKRYGAVLAVDDVSLSVEQGELFGFLGPNGAGKSTTIGMLCTLLRPSAGQASVNGFDIKRQESSVRRSIGIIFQDPSLDEQLTAAENLALHARIYNLPGSIWKARAADLLALVDLESRRNSRVETYSRGMKRRLELARSLLHHPRVLFLDEPTIGLDPQTREHIWRYLDDLRRAEGITLFLTTHYMDEADRCDRIAIIDHGRIVAIDTPARLKALVGGDVITLQAADTDRALANLRSRFQVQPTHENGHLHLEVVDGERFIPRLFADLGVPIQAISLRKPTLDDVFLKLTGGAIRDEDAEFRDVLRGRMRSGSRGVF